MKILRVRLEDKDFQKKFLEYKNGLLNFAVLLISSSKASEEIFITLSKELGSPYVEKQETQEIIQTIQPLKAHARKQTSFSSDVRLEMHIENIGTKKVPDWVGLFCVRNFEKAKTLFLDPVEVLFAMYDKGYVQEIKYLFENKFLLLEPESFSIQAKGTRRKVTSSRCVKALSGELPFLNISLDFEAMYSDSPLHLDALKIFKKISTPYITDIVLKRGDILFIRNTSVFKDKKYRSCMHGRSSFKMDKEAPRLLKRVFIEQK